MSYSLIQKYAEILDGNPVYTVRATVAPFLLAFVWQKHRNAIGTFVMNKERDTLLAVDEKKYFAISQERFADYFSGKISIPELQEEYRSITVRIQNFWAHILLLDLKTSSTTELQSYMSEMLDIFNELAEKSVYIETIDHEKVLAVIGADKKAALDAIWEKATHAAFISFEGRRLGILIGHIVDGSGNVADIIRKSRFIFTDYFWTKKDGEIKSALSEIKSDLSGKKAEYAHVKKQADARAAEDEAWKKGLDADMRSIAEYIQLMMYFRDIRKDDIAQIQAVMCELAEEMLCRADIDMAYAPTILIYEYIKGPEYLKSIKDSIIKRPAGCISLVYTDGSYDIELCDFDQALKEFNEVIFTKDVNVDAFKGQIANKGKVTGIVRIVIDPHDDKGFRKGDIMVTSMTRPEFVPLMKQAGGVITNEGGVTCHAAIVSRELGIPCIIGTKIATRVLKDGDRVEVDANKGIVRILN